MRVRKATRLALTLLVVSGMGVSGALASGKGTTSSKPGTVNQHPSKSRHRGAYRHSSRRQHGQKAPTADRISEIQSALAKDGSFSGTPNGRWDAATVDAMKRFQDSHGLNATGKLDAKTLQKLGLGSQTAGIAPPMPPVSSTSLATSPTVTVPRLP